jgi:5-methyltetrahydrofolate--homocysteine methyltransferase
VALDLDNRELQERLRVQHAEKIRKPLLSLERARENRAHVPFDDLPVPPFIGTREVAPELVELVQYIDWQFFFHAWDLKGKFPAILDNPAAQELYDDARETLAEIVREGQLQTQGVYGYWPAHTEGDDIVVGDTTFNMLRQQADHGDERSNRSLADFVAPAGDHVGAFAVSIHGAEELSARFAADHDDYTSIVVKALADRLAEAFAEWLHLRARREWYAPEEHLPTDGLIRETFRGIRPAFGYPACPDHTEKRKLFDLLGAERAGMGLTESFAMTPAAAVSGIYFANPQAKYFAVGRIGPDQLADYAVRKGDPVAELERWLSPNLG